MNNLRPAFSLGLRRSPSLPVINLLMLYENRATALRAKNVLDRIASAFSDQLVFSNEICSFDTLRYACLREVALHELGDADLVVISIRNEIQVPRDILCGIAAWHRQEGGSPPAAIVLWDRAGKNAMEIEREQARLKALAVQKGIDLLVEGSEFPDENFDGQIGQRCRFRGIFPASEINAYEDLPAFDAHWGINE